MRDEFVTMTKPAIEAMKFDIWKQGAEMAAQYVAAAASRTKTDNDRVTTLQTLAYNIRALTPAEFVKTEPDNPYYWMWKEHQARFQAADRKLLAIAKRSLDIFKSISSKSLIVDELTSAIEEFEKI